MPQACPIEKELFHHHYFTSGLSTMAFCVGSSVETRGEGRRRGKIMKVVDKAVCDVEFEDGTVVEMRTSQLQHPKSVSAVQAVKNALAEVISPSNMKKRASAQPPPPPSPPQNNDDTFSAQSNEDVSFSRNNNDTTFSTTNKDSVGHNTAAYSNDSDLQNLFDRDEEEVAEADINDKDLDEEEEEDVNLEKIVHRCEAALFDSDEARRNARTKRYMEEKEDLVNRAVEYVKVVQPKGLEVGALVETRKKDATTNEPERGIIEEKVWDEKGSGAPWGKKKYSWRVRLNSGEEKNYTSHQLKRQDNEGTKKYVWKVVNDHYPDEYHHNYDEEGVIGFDFAKFFENSIDVDSKDYTYPFAKLFQHLFPGDPKDVVRRMNAEVRSSNAASKKNVKDAWIRYHHFRR